MRGWLVSLVRFTPAALLVDAATGDDEVHVRMVDALPGPGVQQRGGAGQTTEPFGVGGQVEQNTRTDPHEQFQQLAGMRTNQPAQLLRHGKGDQVIDRARQQEGTVLAQPLPGPRAAARRTVAVPATHEGEVPLPAAGTGPTGPPRRGRMTRFDIAHGLELVMAHALAQR